MVEGPDKICPKKKKKTTTTPGVAEGGGGGGGDLHFLRTLCTLLPCSHTNNNINTHRIIPPTVHCTTVSQ